MMYRNLVGQRLVFFLLIASLSVSVSELRPRAVRAAVPQSAACVEPAPGLVSWYRSEGTTTDSGGNNNGTAFGNVAYIEGRNGRAFNFDGNSEVIVPTADSLNPQNITLEVWVYPALIDGNFDLIAAKETEPSGTYHYEIAIKGPRGGPAKIPVGNLAFAIYGIIGLPDDYLSWVDGGGQVPLNTWTHVAMTFDGTTAKAYINGKVTRTITGLRGKMPETNGSLRLGGRSPAVISKAPQDRFNGRIDEFSIYNRALTPAELENIVRTVDTGRCYNSAPMVTFERGSSLTRQQGSPAAMITLATVSDEQTPAGNLTAKLASVPAGLSITNLTNTNGAIKAQVAANCTATIGAIPLTLSVSDGKLTTTGTVNVTVTPNTPPELGTYPNTTVAFEKGATVTPSTILNDNGTIASLTVIGAPGATANAVTGAITIPTATPVGAYTLTVKATDNCGAATTRVFSLTINQVCSPAPSGLAAWFRGENNANDALGANHGTLQNGVAFAAGKVGQAFNFDGVNDAVLINKTLGNFGSADFTIGFWIKTTATRIEAVMGKRELCDHASFWSVRTINGQLLLELDQADGGTYNLLKSDKTVNDGTFHHIMLARQGVTLQLFLDGALERSQIRARQANVSNPAAFVIGNDVCVGVDKTKPFTGQLDEVEIYSRALSAADALDVFKAGRLGRCPILAIGGDVAFAQTAALNARSIVSPEQTEAESVLVSSFNPSGKPSVLVSAFRLSGPAGANDWFVELVNNSAAPVSTNGLTLGLVSQTGKEVLSFALQPDQVIAPYGAYLVAGSAYSLSVTAARPNGVIPDQQQAALPFESAAAAALFAGLPLVANRLDAVSTNFGLATYSEGMSLPFLNGTLAEHAFVRRFIAPSQPQDTQDNRNDFTLVATAEASINGQTPLLGTVVPRNRVMPARRLN